MLGWQRALSQADLSVRRRDGRTRVSSSIVFAVGVAVSHFMDGPKGHDPGGNAFPGRELLAKRVRRNAGTIDAALGALVDKGWLVQTDRGHTGQRATYAAAIPFQMSAEEPTEGRVSTPTPSPKRRGQDQTEESWSGQRVAVGTSRESRSGPAESRGRDRDLPSAVDLHRGPSLAPEPCSDPPPAPVSEGKVAQLRNDKQDGRAVLVALPISDAWRRQLLDHSNTGGRRNLVGILDRLLATNEWTVERLAELLAADWPADTRSAIGIMLKRARDWTEEGPPLDAVEDAAARRAVELAAVGGYASSMARVGDLADDEVYELCRTRYADDPEARALARRTIERLRGVHIDVASLASLPDLDDLEQRPDLNTDDDDKHEHERRRRRLGLVNA